MVTHSSSNSWRDLRRMTFLSSAWRRAKRGNGMYDVVRRWKTDCRGATTRNFVLLGAVRKHPRWAAGIVVLAQIHLLVCAHIL